MTDERRRRLLVATTTVAVAGGTGLAAVPFVLSMMPSERAKAGGAPVEVDIGSLEPTQKMTVEWRGRPVWIVRRTPEMLEAVRADDDVVADPYSKQSDQPAYAVNRYRSRKPEYLVVIGICTHLGCSPVDRFERVPQPFDVQWKGGFYCPCHGSLFDLAGRVYKNKPAPTNLAVPPYQFSSTTKVVIGDDAKAA